MNKCILAVSSVNLALKSEKALAQKRIKASVTRLDPSKTRKGCSYGLLINCSDLAAAESVLSLAGIKYTEEPSGI